MGGTNTITSVQKDNLVLEISEDENGQLCPTLTAQNQEVYRVEGSVTKGNTTYRIRKLTPKECWRLMGFSDEDFAKAEKVNSNTQLYKQAGNSIVKQVLMAIFREMMPQDGVKYIAEHREGFEQIRMDID